MGNEIATYLKINEKNMIADIGDFIKIPSITSDRVQVGKALDFVLNLGAGFGFKSYKVFDGEVGIIEMGEGNEILGILTHVDVVSPGDLTLWDSDPYELINKNGFVFGRGVLDDKGPIISCLYAMKALKDLNFSLKKRIRMIIGTREEEEWSDIQKYVESYELPTYGFTPDGEFPLCNIEKGYIDIELVFPNNKENLKGTNILEINGGVSVNTVPAECIVSLNNKPKNFIEVYSAEENNKIIDYYEKENLFYIKAIGKSAHSSMPENGSNAINILANFLLKCEIDDSSIKKIVNLINEKFSDCFGKKIGLDTEEERWNGEYIHKNTISLTTIKTEDNLVKVNFNLRPTLGTSVGYVKNIFDNLALKIGANCHYGKCLEPIYIEKEKPFIKMFADVFDKYSGQKNEYLLAYGTSYAKAMPNIVAWGPVFPGEEDTCHEANEKLSIKSLRLMTLIYSQALKEIVTSSKSFK